MRRETAQRGLLARRCWTKNLGAIFELPFVDQVEMRTIKAFFHDWRAQPSCASRPSISRLICDGWRRFGAARSPLGGANNGSRKCAL
jgi:hypothetical protein